ncbi:MAG: nucleotidyltransferase family protein [Anaerolineales bacterium]
MITAIVLAAGQSRRMGQPKMLLPWGQSTVLGKVIETFTSAGAEEILVVTGGAREQVEALVGNSAKTVFNPDHAQGEMLSSVQIGLSNASGQAALIALGDQPKVRERSVRSVMEAYARGQAAIIVPSYKMRRGHPWLIAKTHWGEILKMKPGQTLRNFLDRHHDEIQYVNVDDPGILQDLDTPDDYEKHKP